jgi:hypothetical protein
MLPSLRVHPKRISLAMTRLHNTGQSMFLRIISSMVINTITSGRWEIQVPVVLVLRFT